MIFPNQLYPDGTMQTGRQPVDVMGALMALKMQQQAQAVKDTAPARPEPQTQRVASNRHKPWWVHDAGSTSRPPTMNVSPMAMAGPRHNAPQVAGQAGQSPAPPAPQGYFANPQHAQNPNILAKLQSMYGNMQPNIEYGATPYQFPRAGLGQGLGTWAQHAVTAPQVGIRAFAQQHGLEDYLEWDAANKGVTLAGHPVDYSFGYQGRTYADQDVLLNLLRQIQQERRGR